MNPALVIIPCGEAKLATPAPASQLYTGSYFRACRRAAQALQPRAGYLILSAKHGLVFPTTVLQPYDMTMGHPRSVTTTLLLRQAQTLKITDLSPVVAFGGRGYVAAARSVWPDLIAPCGQAAGMGHQMRMMAIIARTGKLP